MAADGNQLSLGAIATLSTPAIAGELSPLGGALLSATRAAVDIASHGLTTEEIVSVSADLAAQIMPAVIPALESILVTVGAEAAAAGLGAAASVIPAVGSWVADMVAMATAQAAAEKEKNVAKCHEQFKNIGPGTGWPGGKLTPADIFGVGSTCAGVFRAVGEGDYADSTVEVSIKGYPPISGPTGAKNIAAAAAAEKKMGLGTNFYGNIGNPTGIPDVVRAALKQMRESMRLSRVPGNVDGGRTLFPLYMDLFLAQYRLGRMTPGLAKYITRTRLAWQYDNIGNCFQYEQRGYQQFEAILHGWDLTANPLYGADVGALQGLIAQATAKKAPSVKLNPKALRLARAHHRAVVSLKKPTHPAAAVASFGTLGAAAYGLWRFLR